MTKKKYFYIDDENGDSELSTIHGFNDVNLVEVERFPLNDFREFGNLRSELIKQLSNNNISGLIIDLRLDGSGEARTEFNATAISQELRSLSARGELKAFPIILCSTEEKIKQTYNADKTSHDLFDYKISKSNPSPNWSKISCKLKSLAEGYEWLAGSPSIMDILGINNFDELDERIKESFDGLNIPYDYAFFIINNFFHQTNPLINEKVLAARLGVDIELTPIKSWQTLKEESFEKAKYTGLFSKGWNRWWAYKVNDIFFSISDKKLAFLKAEERIEILKNITKINDLVPAQPIKFCNSTEFWTICEGLKKPIDPLEAFKIYTTANLKPWHESKYLSLLAILEREGIDRGLRPHLSENDRIKYTREILGL